MNPTTGSTTQQLHSRRSKKRRVGVAHWLKIGNAVSICDRHTRRQTRLARSLAPKTASRIPAADWLPFPIHRHSSQNQNMLRSAGNSPRHQPARGLPLCIACSRTQGHQMVTRSRRPQRPLILLRCATPPKSPAHNTVHCKQQLGRMPRVF